MRLGLGLLTVGLLASSVSVAGAQGTPQLPTPVCATRTVVPILAPDTVAENVLDSLGTITSPAIPGVHYLRNMIAARFDSTASPSQRQAAVDRVCGVVVGGDHSDGGVDGYYLVRLQGAGTVSALDAAAAAMRQMPGVASAQTLALRRAAAPAPAAASACADGDSGGAIRIAALKEMVASHDAGDRRLVDGLGLAGVDSSQVRIVQDPAVCGRVAAAIRAAVHFTPDGVPFLVLRAGGRYVAFDPSGMNRSYFLVDTAFVFRKILR